MFICQAANVAESVDVEVQKTASAIARLHVTKADTLDVAIPALKLRGVSHFSEI